MDFDQDISFIKDKQLFRLRAAALIIRDNKLLMAWNKKDDHYYSIGGAVRLGESLEAAVIREVCEECGIEMNIDRLLAVHQNFFQGLKGYDWHEISFYYLMDSDSVEDWSSISTQQSRNMYGVEQGVAWLSIDQYEETKAYPLFFKDIKQILLEDGPLMLVTKDL